VEASSSYAWISVAALLLSCGLLVAVVVVSVILIRRSQEQTRAGEATLQKIAARVPPEGQALFSVQLNEVKKNPSNAVILALFLGGVGLHKFYLDETGAGIAYLIFCWTGIPVLISFVEAFGIADKANRYNLQRATELAVLLGADV
jgi:TM2 domain-containing membrane protein YozV